MSYPLTSVSAIPPLPTPRQILATLLPPLKIAAAYAQEIQGRIKEQPEKDESGLFASVLTDADLSIQTFMEVLLLGHFPQLRFYGEEHHKSWNTKYFRAISLGELGDYLVTLDPIDGTRYYADGHYTYQIILNVLNEDQAEATLLIQPAQGRYYYGLRGQGAFVGKLSDEMEACRPLQITPQSQRIYLGGAADHFAAHIEAPYEAYDVYQNYSASTEMPGMVSVLEGAYAASILGRAHLVDGVAIAFLAQEAGWIVTTHEGIPPPPLSACKNYRQPGLLIAPSKAVHADLLGIIQATTQGKLA